MSPADPPRLLPWLTEEDGKPCYLLSSDPGGYLSRLADTAENRLLTTGADVLSQALPVLKDPLSSYTEVRYTGLILVKSLRNALRVAESRGTRIPLAGFSPDDPDADTGGDEPHDGGSRSQPRPPSAPMRAGSARGSPVPALACPDS